MKMRYPDMLALVAHGVPVALHHHYAVQLVMSLDDDYTATLAGHSYPGITGFLVDANIPHACQPAGASVLIISIDAATTRGKRLREWLANRPFILLHEFIAPEIVTGIRTAYWGHMATHQPFDLLAAIPFLAEDGKEVLMDGRVEMAMEYITAHIADPLRMRDIAQVVALSESRLRHLFLEETGIPLTRYILWSRMKVALHALIRRQMNLGTAALHAGYADHAHFTRTFKRMFGVSPSLLLRHSKVLQVFDGVDE